jgi:hypothetical protein
VFLSILESSRHELRIVHGLTLMTPSPRGWEAFPTPRALTHTRITWTFSPPAPQVPGVAPGSPLCPWCFRHLFWRGARHPQSLRYRCQALTPRQIKGCQRTQVPQSLRYRCQALTPSDQGLSKSSRSPIPPVSLSSSYTLSNQVFSKNSSSPIPPVSLSSFHTPPN